METKVAKRHGGDTVDSPPKNPKTRDETVESSAVFILAALRAKQPPPSIFKLDASAVAGGDGLRRVAELPGGSHAMSFVAVHSEHGSWIVGVGGLRGEDTIIYEPSTGDVLQGPDLSYPKRNPILISHLGKVYAISRHPRVHYKSRFDWLPWFESLNFKKGVPCTSRRDDNHNIICHSIWRPLPLPPCFPYFLEPLEFRNPPDVTVSSYAAVGSHILLSLEQQETGTYAFHVVEKTWDKVCEKNLPFVGQAVPLGGSLFAACCIIPDNAATSVCVLHMSMEVFSTPTVSGKLTTAIIHEFQKFMVSSQGQVPRPILCPLGKGSFCSIRFQSSCQSRKRKYSKGLQIILTAFQMDNIKAFWTNRTEVKDLDIPIQVKQHNQTYNIHVGSPFLASHMPVVTALSMRTSGPEEPNINPGRGEGIPFAYVRREAQSRIEGAREQSRGGEGVRPEQQAQAATEPRRKKRTPCLTLSTNVNLEGVDTSARLA